MLNRKFKPHLITFGIGEGYRRSARRLISQAKASDLFDSQIGIYEKNFQNHLPTTLQKIAEISTVTKQNLGFGLWFWKPDVILSAMLQVPENDVVVYLDAGCSLNLKKAEAIERFSNYIELASRNGVFAMQLWDGEFEQTDLTDRYWGFSDLNDFLQADETHLSSNQIQAGILFVKNCQESRIFLEKWRSIMELDNFKYLIGPTKGNYRYDQSVFSLLYKKAKYPTIPDETYFYPFWECDGELFPIWATRVKDGVDPFRFNLNDLIYRLSRKIRNFISLWTGHSP
jgi:hypothetical protein